MIIGITGAICSGKRAFAEYLVKTYGFEFVDLLELFRIELAKQGLPIQMQSSPNKKKKHNNDGTSEEDEESKSSSNQDSQNNPEVESADSE